MPNSFTPPKHLPISDVLQELHDSLIKHNELVLEAPPGAGKTTIVPLSLLDAPWLSQQNILMLEPRRMAARAAATQMAKLLGENVGQTVGYRVRQDVVVSNSTRIEVVTEGILIRRLQEDPSLEGVGLVIFDEFHERSIDSDFGLALCLQSRELFREDSPLKILAMSATLDGEQVSTYLSKAPIIRSEGKMYPVELSYLGAVKGTSVTDTRKIHDPILCAVQKALDEETGNILVFLPGQKEILNLQRDLSSKVGQGTLIAPLFGGLNLTQQNQAIEAPPEGMRKIVLATDIAETSLTIEGVRIVIDSGLARKPRFDPKTGMTRLATERISKASAKQRMGRAGRLEKGSCYRLWSEEQHQQLAQQSKPEILDADLSSMVLQMLSWGASSLDDLAWLTSPTEAAFNQALDLLQALEALDESRTTLSDIGRAMAALPTHPRLGHMMVKSKGLGLSDLACKIAAILAERAPAGFDEFSSLVELLDSKKGCPKLLSAWCSRILKQAKSFEKLIKSSNEQSHTNKTSAGLLLCLAYPDRIGQRRSAQNSQRGDIQYQLSNGRSAKLDGTSKLANEEWLVVSDLGGVTGQSEDRIFLAEAIDPSLFDKELSHLCQREEIVEWDQQKERFIAESRQMLGAIILKREALKNIPDEAKREALISLLRKQGLKLLPWTPATKQWQARVQLLHTHCRNENQQWPNVSDNALLENLEEWLGPYLEDIRKLSDFQQLKLNQILEALLPWPLPQKLNELAPERFRVPSGSNISIDYTQNPPTLAVKLQEMFGCQKTPSVANGKVPLMIHLLSPAGRPLQITQDLGHFWNNSYENVKKEMKGRYPKHPWPDNPLEAEATRFTKHRKNKTVE